MKPKQARQEMPKVAAFIDDLRAAFGAQHINEQMRLGVKEGQPVFWARENGREIGTRVGDDSNSWALEGLSQRRFCKGCQGECVGTAQACMAGGAPGAPDQPAASSARCVAGND